MHSWLTKNNMVLQLSLTETIQPGDDDMLHTDSWLGFSLVLLVEIIKMFCLHVPVSKIGLTFPNENGELVYTGFQFAYQD